MSSISIKAFYLNNFPKNGKLSNIEIKNIKKFEFHPNQQNEIYKKLFAELNNLFSLKLNNHDEIITCFCDEDDYLISFASDKELMDQAKTNKASNFNIYFLIQSNSISNNQTPSIVNQDNSDSMAIISNIFNKTNINIPEDKLLNLEVICDGCKGRIFGFRYKCTKCKDYDLCNECHEKGIHREHSFDKLRPYDNIFEGWSCDICNTKDLQDKCFLCKECSKERFDNKNEFCLCLKCETTHSKTHTLLEYSTNKIVNKRTFQIMEIENLKSNSVEIPKFNGVNCSFCKTDGVLFKLKSLLSNGSPVCELCFLKGVSRYDDFGILTSDEVKQIMDNIKKINEIKMLELQSNMNHQQFMVQNAQFRNKMNLLNSALFRVNL